MIVLDENGQGAVLTLRDLFAAFALAGLAAVDGLTTDDAEDAYRAADAMLEVRSGRAAKKRELRQEAAEEARRRVEVLKAAGWKWDDAAEVMWTPTGMTGHPLEVAWEMLWEARRGTLVEAGWRPVGTSMFAWPNEGPAQYLDLEGAWAKMSADPASP